MAAISTQVPNYDTGALTMTTVNASDDYECPTAVGQIGVFVRNASGGSVVCTLSGFTRTTDYGEVLPVPGPITITAGNCGFIPLHPQFDNGSSRVVISYSAQTSITAAAVRF